MRSEEEYQRTLDLIRAGINDCEVGRRFRIPRGTIRDWRVGLPRSRDSVGGCFRCHDVWIDREAYAYLLGFYLGDGCLSAYPRDVFRLRVSCDLKYPDIVNEIANCIVIVRGKGTVGFTPGQGCVEVHASWKHWPCVFPQHGPGRQHDRTIELVAWQQAFVDTHRKALIRGLIHSDGNRHINEVARVISSGPKRYRYPRYMFTNASTDILGIFTDSLDMLGVHWTQTSPRDVAVSRRDDVAFLDTFVGPKR